MLFSLQLDNGYTSILFHLSSLFFNHRSIKKAGQRDKWLELVILHIIYRITGFTDLEYIAPKCFVYKLDSSQFAKIDPSNIVDDQMDPPGRVFPAKR